MLGIFHPSVLSWCTPRVLPSASQLLSQGLSLNSIFWIKFSYLETPVCSLGGVIDSDSRK